jgi:multidrug efflux pump subunit AcrA (membrane-fusion protein)
MRSLRLVGLFVFLFGGLFILSGCGKKESSSHSHEDEREGGEGHGHSHGEESSSGASFKAGSGVIVTEETKKILNLQTAEVSEQRIPNLIHFTVQVFGEKHRPSVDALDHSGCDVQGSGFLSALDAASIKAGQPLQLTKGSNVLKGVVLAVQKAQALGEVEIVVGAFNAGSIVKDGEFVPARISLPPKEAVPSIPKSSLLRTAEGTFTYVVNGEAYLRTPVKPGSEADGWVEVTDGLLPGDEVVTKPVETLWLIELRATKGGGHSH